MKLYIDCDGVILDTINYSYKMLEEKNIIAEKEKEKFYKNIDWNQLIKDSGEINDSINKIKELSKRFDIEILTHVYSENELSSKREYFDKMLPNINVIAVPKGIEKADYVDAKKNILIDDYTPNLDYWKEKGGISIKFSNKEKEYNYVVISDLLEVLKICEEKVKE